ncbi:MAG: hypothetical protein V3U09_00640, partial [Thermoplasmata archaeon]
ERFWDRGWHQADNWYTFSSTLWNKNNIHRDWNRDWAGFITHRGDGKIFTNYVNMSHCVHDCTGEGGLDRGNVSVKVIDVDGNPIDGAMVSLGSWKYYGIQWVVGTRWFYTNQDGIVFFTTSETRQDGQWNDGLRFNVRTKFGGYTLNPFYSARILINFDASNNVQNQELYEITMQVTGNVPRPHPPTTEVAPPPPGLYRMEVDFEVLEGFQYPANALGENDGMYPGMTPYKPQYHVEEFNDDVKIDAFIANGSNFQSYLKGSSFDSHNTTFNTTDGSMRFPIPAAGDWYFVLSNQDSGETTKLVNVSVRLYDGSSVIDDSVLPPTNLSIGLTGDAYQNVTLMWTLSGDDGAGEADVIGYNIYAKSKYNRSRIGYYKLGFVPSGTTSFTHVNAGNGYIGLQDDGLDNEEPYHFYYIAAEDDDGNEASPPGQVGKFIRELDLGMNLISFPLVPSDPSTDVVLQTVSFDSVWHYNAGDADPWKTQTTFKPYGGSLLELNNKMGIWVNVKEFSFLTVVGHVADSTQITLKTGWNLISYPSYAEGMIASVLSSVPYERVEGFNLFDEPYRLRVYSDSDLMVPGYAYWVKVGADSIVEVYI